MADRALTTEPTGSSAEVASTPSPGRLLPYAHWNATAGEIGRMAGRAVAGMRAFPRLVEDVRWQLRNRLRRIRQQSPGAPANRLEQMRETAACRMEALEERAQERLQLLRNRARRLQRERPVELIAGAFGAAFLLGMSLRIWRSNGD